MSPRYLYVESVSFLCPFPHPTQNHCTCQLYYHSKALPIIPSVRAPTVIQSSLKNVNQIMSFSCLSSTDGFPIALKYMSFFGRLPTSIMLRAYIQTCHVSLYISLVPTSGMGESWLFVGQLSKVTCTPHHFTFDCYVDEFQVKVINTQCLNSQSFWQMCARDLSHIAGSDLLMTYNSAHGGFPLHPEWSPKS